MKARTADSLTVKPITRDTQKAKLKELQLVCLPNDEPIACALGGCSVALYDKRTMVAFGLAQRTGSVASPLYPNADTLYLSRAGVHPDYRGLGLQRRLIRLREEWAVARGFTWAVTDTAHHSIASMRSLIAEGYKPYWPEEPWALPSSVYWRKQLA